MNIEPGKTINLTVTFPDSKSVGYKMTLPESKATPELIAETILETFGAEATFTINP